MRQPRVPPRSGRLCPLGTLAALALVLLAASAAGAAEFAWEPQPAPRNTWTLIYDPSTDHVVSFGPPGEVWTRSLTPDSLWRRLRPAGTPPAVQVSSVAAVLDPLRRRMLVLGGGTTTGVWALGLDGIPAWQELVATGTAPGPSASLRAFYEPRGDALVVTQGSTFWRLALDGSPSWEPLAAVGPVPPPRPAAEVALDTLRGRILLHGGGQCASMTNCGPIYSDLWAFSLDSLTWRQLAASGQPSFGGWLEFDPLHDRIVGSGGLRGHLLSAPLWAQALESGGFVAQTLYNAAHPRGTLDLVNWAQGRLLSLPALDNNVLQSTPLTGGPPQPIDRAPGVPALVPAPSSVAWDARRHRLIAFGSVIGAWATDELWALALDGQPLWTRLTTGGPAARAGASLIVDPVRDRLVLYGGFTDAGWFTDTWVMDLSGAPAWVQLPVSSTRISYGGPAAYDPVNDRMLVWTNTHPSQDEPVTMALDLAHPQQWAVLPAAGEPPPFFAQLVTVWDPVRDRWLVASPGLHAFDPASGVWSALGSGTVANDVYDTSVSFDPVGDRLLFFGGHHATGDLTGVLAVRLTGAPANETVTLENAGPALGWNAWSAYDPALDRFIVTGRALGGPDLTGVWALARHAALPLVVFAFDDSGAPGGMAGLPIQVSNPFPHDMTFGVYGRPARGWRVAHARVQVPASYQATVNLPIAVPDSAAPGPVSIVVEAGPEGLPMLAATSATLTVTEGAGNPGPGPYELAFLGATPNPARDRIEVSFTLPRASTVRLEVLDPAGRVVAGEGLERGAGPQHHVLQAPLPRPGLYWLRLSVDGTRITRRVALLR